jgi:hypothetical protein
VLVDDLHVHEQFRPAHRAGLAGRVGDAQRGLAALGLGEVLDDRDALGSERLDRGQSTRAFLAAARVAPEVFKLRPDYCVLLTAAEGPETGTT